jgi:hypothetical protein
MQGIRPSVGTGSVTSSSAIEQQSHPDYVAREWRGSKLPAVLAGDVAAAGISATLISPIITAIDRLVLPPSHMYHAKNLIELWLRTRLQASSHCFLL